MNDYRSRSEKRAAGDWKRKGPPPPPPGPASSMSMVALVRASRLAARRHLAFLAAVKAALTPAQSALLAQGACPA